MSKSPILQAVAMSILSERGISRLEWILDFVRSSAVALLRLVWAFVS